MPHNVMLFLSPGDDPFVPRGGQDGTRPRWHGKGQFGGKGRFIALCFALIRLIKCGMCLSSAD